MLEILAIIGPVFIIIAIGFISVRAEVVSKAECRGLGKFVITFALPAMMFRALSERSLAEVMNTDYLLAYTLGSLASFAFGFGWARWRQGENLPASAIRGLGTSVSNGFICYAVLLQFLGPASIVALALTFIVENILLIPLVLAIAESSGSSGQKFHRVVLQTLGRLAKNPLILSIAAGVGCAMLEVKLPGPLAKVVELFALSAVSVALFVIGGTLVGQKLGGMVDKIGIVTFGKLVIHPLAIFIAFLLVAPVDPVMHAAALTIASISMLSIYPILGQKYGQEGICAATLVATTTLAFLTISTMIWLIRSGIAIPGFTAS